MTRRLKGMGMEKYSKGFGEIVVHPKELSQPGKWKPGQLVFVNSMSDMFHKDIPIPFIQDVFKTMNQNPQHIFQVLTKRAEILNDYDQRQLVTWSPNIWQGVSIESPKFKYRIDLLRSTGAKIKFLSIEPLIRPIGSLQLRGIDWVIVGGESGQKVRKMEIEWVREIRDQCNEQGVRFFFKQWGGRDKKLSGRVLDNRTHDDLPEHFQKSL